MTLDIAPTADIDACRALRRTVFIDEQGIAESDEIDDLDGEATHLLARVDSVPVGSARLLYRGTTGKIGRVCVLGPHRGGGIGTALIGAALDHFRARDGLTMAKLGAQVTAIAFYEASGFVAQGPVYDDAGVAHRDMTCTL